jgi:hypothetical protein
MPVRIYRFCYISPESDRHYTTTTSQQYILCVFDSDSDIWWWPGDSVESLEPGTQEAVHAARLNAARRMAGLASSSTQWRPKMQLHCPLKRCLKKPTDYGFFV